MESSLPVSLYQDEENWIVGSYAINARVNDLFSTERSRRVDGFYDYHQSHSKKEKVLNSTVCFLHDCPKKYCNVFIGLI